MEVERFADSPVGTLRRIAGVDGRYNRSYEHVAFVADPLGDEPPLTNATWRAVTRARSALARLQQASRQVPNPHLLRQPTLRREAQSTSALEGTLAPIEEVLAADASEDGRTAALTEVMNYVRAADRAFERVIERGGVSVSLVEDIHATLVRGTESKTRDAGRVRTCQVAIGSANGTIESARFVPMPPGVELEAATRDLLDWANRGPSRDREPVVAAAMAHYQFETLHPFNDGNGRIGRLLIVLQFMIDGLIDEPLLSVSPWFEARRSTYRDRLAQVSATGDWNPWVQFFSEGIEASAVDTAERVDLLLDIQQDYVQRLQEAGSRGGLARDIVDLLIGSPIVTVPMLARRFGKTQQGVNLAVKKLIGLKILSGPQGSYNRLFVAMEMYQAMTAPMGAVPTGRHAHARDER